MAAAFGLLAVAMRFEAERQGSGIGAVLDTKRNLADAEVKRLEMQLDGALNHSQRAPEAEDELRRKLSHARERREAASRTSDAVVIAKLHVQGAAFKSGRIASGDVLVEVDGRPVGSNVDLAGNLIRGEMHTRVSLTVLKADGSRAHVQLQRAYIPGHPTNEAPISILGF